MKKKKKKKKKKNQKNPSTELAINIEDRAARVISSDQNN